MMGIKNVEAKLFYEFSLDRRVPEDHLLRRIEQAVDFSFIYSLTRPYYSTRGSPQRTRWLCSRWLSWATCTG
jgi:hypothetical protein